jgi:hypothetical protein
VIRGYIRGGLAWINAQISLPSLETDYVEVRLLIDTGATRTVLQPFDQRKLGLNPRLLFPDPRAVLMGGFGGDVRALETTGVLRFVESVEPRDYAVTVCLLEPVSRPSGQPSVVGMDFLRHFRLTISVSEDMVELERLG